MQVKISIVYIFPEILSEATQQENQTGMERQVYLALVLMFLFLKLASPVLPLLVPGVQVWGSSLGQQNRPTETHT